jgi:predicted ABC-type transport system involved in lysophospholipase L1 biosynthesis ATPase subunit
MGILIQAEGLSKTYRLPRKEVEVLKDVSLEVSEGESIAVVGVSGAGKSTLLHVIGGLDRPESGRVLMDGKDLYAMSGGQRARIRSTELGFVFQSYNLLPEMDVLENVMLPAMARGFMPSRDKLKSKAMELLEVVGLIDRVDHTPMELSGGEQQRVALARALMNDPQVVLADEPTGNLDEGTGGKILEHLFSLTKSRGHSLILVTHDDGVAAECDRVLRLKDGVLVD